MLANPFGDIGLRGHHALLERTIPDELKIFFFAIGGIGDGTDGQDDFNQSFLPSKHGFVIMLHITPVSLLRLKIPTKIALPAGEQSVPERLTKSPALTLDASVQCFEHTR
jgi:hypothetical protein